MKSNEKYLQFPLFLLRELLIDKEKTIDKIIRYGIYRFSKKLDYELTNVAKQLMYCYYRKTGDLTNDLRKAIQSYIDAEMIDLDVDYNGFSGANFNPETEIEQLLEIFENNTDFKEKAIEFYLIRQAYEFLGMRGNFENCLKVGKQIDKTIPDNEPFPMVSKSLLFEFRDNGKSEFDLMQLACYIGIRSILGIKPYCKTNKEMIIARAFGYSSKKQLPENPNQLINELLIKYQKRYHIDKILQHLELNWNILTYSNNIRGLYVALKKKISIDELVLIAETKKQINRIEELKKAKHEAKVNALQHINKRE